MRTWLAALPLLSLAACGGGGGTGPETVGSVPPPTAGTGTPTPTDIYSQFAQPVEAKTYAAIGGQQVHEYLTDERVVVGQQGATYAGTASTVRNSAISVSYDPRDAIFILKVTDPNSGAATSTRFQDPVARTDFGGAREPQWGVPDLAGLAPGTPANANIQFLQSGDGDLLSPFDGTGTGYIDRGDNTNPPIGGPDSSIARTTLFVEKPGSTTKYVTLAGYVRNQQSFSTEEVGFTIKWHLERGAFAYGAQTGNSAVPTSGTGSYAGSMLGTMVYNPTFDEAELPTYFQWLSGTSAVSVDFGSGKVRLALAGTVLAPQIDRLTTPTTSYLPAGSTFAASGSAIVDLVNTGGFKGSFVGGAFTFTAPTGSSFADGTTSASVNVIGSSIDGAFFGPKAEEVGGGFRVVGGVPDQRVDIIGAFTGKK